MPVSKAGLSCPGWVNCRCLMMRPFGCRTTPAWNGPFLQFLPYLATSSADSLVSFTHRPLSAMALPAACAPLLADGLHGFGCECFGIEAFILEPEIYGTGVAEEDDALFVLDDGDALRVVWIVVPGAGIGFTVSAFEWDEFVGIVVDHGYSLQIHLVAVYDR